MDQEKYVDESWKERATVEKSSKDAESLMENVSKEEKTDTPESSLGELDFVGYLTSLAFQAVVFLGEVPNPMTNETEKNLRQAKFLIDTLVLLREKTKGNLNKQEEDILNTSIYELQLKYVEGSRAESESQSLQNEGA